MLSKTQVGQVWIKQFEEEDRGAAKKLLDLVEYYSEEEIRKGLRLAMKDVLGRDEGPWVLFPARALEDYMVKRLDEAGCSSRGEGSSADCGRIPVMFEEIDGAILSSTPGSEGVVGNIIRQVQRESNGKVIGKLELNELREKRVRKILLVTDCIASGKQVLDTVRSWYACKTIKSWHSLGLVKFEVLSYAASDEGRKKVENHHLVDKVSVLRRAPTLFDSSDESLKELCEKYAKKYKLRNRALGFGEVGILCWSAMSVPNNMPAILIDSGKRWRPIFPGRRVEQSVMDEIKLITVSNLLGAKDVRNIWRPMTIKGKIRDWQWGFRLLLDGDGDLPPGVASFLNLGVLKKVALEWGLLDGGRRCTKKGAEVCRVMQELEKRQTVGRSDEFDTSRIIYYPRVRRWGEGDA